MPELKPGDVIVVWGNRLISYLIYAVFGIHDPASHAEMVYNEVDNISSDIGGVKLRPTARLFKAKKWVVLRNKRLTFWTFGDPVQAAAKKHIGRGYDYALYAIWIMRISLILQPLIWLIGQPFRNWLKREEAKRFTCSELVVQILKDLGITTGIDEPHNACPDNLLEAGRACVHDWEFVASGGVLK